MRHNIPLTLSKMNGCWVVTDRRNTEWYKLFGTYSLPTPYRDSTPQETVVASIMRKNPRRTVEVCP